VKALGRGFGLLHAVDMLRRDLVSRSRPKAGKAQAGERSYSVDVSGKREEAETRPAGLRGTVCGSYRPCGREFVEFDNQR
jgi:hypothetical protein